ncbi:outer membrane protein assembly factor BamD [Blattabacterium cuenoti]|uniref:outer membrane protein assembly factor BamD n=1 Tax=Blattabacterium cuenoti TaxID=1653831 RepID=UPI00163C7223|nr:hypothetical protein [Blattabacterium cuenoti]
MNKKKLKRINNHSNTNTDNIIDKKNKVNKENEKLLFRNVLNYYLYLLNNDLDLIYMRVAIKKFNFFLKSYPNSSKFQEVNRMIYNLYYKLENEEYNRSKLYFSLHRYESAVIYFQNFLIYFPHSIFKEEILYKICISKYNLDKVKDFFEFYKEYIKNYPNSANAKELRYLYKKLIENE